MATSFGIHPLQAYPAPFTFKGRASAMAFFPPSGLRPDHTDWQPLCEHLHEGTKRMKRWLERPDTARFGVIILMPSFLHHFNVTAHRFVASFLCGELLESLYGGQRRRNWAGRGGIALTCRLE